MPVLAEQSHRPSAADRVARIRQLNDSLRRNRVEGRVVLTQGIAALTRDQLRAVLKAVAEFDTFGTDNDPWGEHDFGALSVLGIEVIWKIDYYDHSLELGSEDPADEAMTVRVLTVMLAREF